MYPQIILLGDSLIQRCFDPATPAFGPALQHAYFRRADVVNRGFGGYNTDWLLPVLERQIIPSVHDVILWVILIGTNDAMIAPAPNHVPIDRYQQNLLRIINSIKEHHASLKTTPRIILLSPPPIRETIIVKELPEQADFRAREVTFAYAQAVMSLPVPSFVELFDFHEAVELAPAKTYIQRPTQYPQSNVNSLRFEEGGMILSMEEYLSDGVHLKNPSYEVMYRLVMDAIVRRWPEISPQNLSMPVPWWGTLVNPTEEYTRAGI